MKRILSALLLLPLSACIIHAGSSDAWEADAQSLTVIDTEVVALEHAAAHQLADIVGASLSHLQRFKVVADARTNSLVLSGTSRELRKAKDLIAVLDVPGGG